MTNTDPRPPPPQNTVQAVGEVAQSVVTGLQAQPLLLALLVLNAIGVGAACWFLSRLVDQSAARMQTLLKACLPNAGGG